MTESEFKRPSARDVARNLRWALNGPLAAFYKDTRKEHAEKAPALTLLIQHLSRDIWNEDPNWALQTAVKEALGILPEGGPEGSRISWREIGEFLCGSRVADIPPKANGERPGYKDYVAEVKDRTGLAPPVRSKRYFGLRVTEAFRLHLARALLQLEPRSRVNAGETAENTPPSESSYVARPTLEVQLRELHARGEKLIVLVGQPGTGKTWLAREVARQLIGADISLIQVFEKKPHLPDLISALRASGISFASDASPIEYLALLLSVDQVPPVVIIDNLESADELRVLLPSQLRTTILATARVTGVAPHPQATFVTIGKMTQAESEALVSHHAPNLDAVEVERVVRELHGYPLVLRHASLLLERGGITISDLVQSLRSTSATMTTVGRMRTEDGARLALVLDRLVDLLQEEDGLAYELLRLLAFVRYYGNVSHQFLFAYAREVETGCARLRASQALQALANFALIDQKNCDVRMHSLTRTLLAARFAVEYDQVYALALRVRAKQKQRCRANEAKYRMPRVNPFELMDNGLHAYHEIDAAWEARYWAARERHHEPPETNEVPDWARVWKAVAFQKVVGEIREQAGLPPLD